MGWLKQYSFTASVYTVLYCTAHSIDISHWRRIELLVIANGTAHPTPIVSGFFKSRPYRNFNPHRLHERGICPITRDCSCFHKCGVTKLHFISPVHSCFFHFEANLTPHVHPSLGKLPSLKRSDDVDVYFSVVSIYCQTTAHSNDSNTQMRCLTMSYVNSLTCTQEMLYDCSIIQDKQYVLEYSPDNQNKPIFLSEKHYLGPHTNIWIL